MSASCLPEIVDPWRMVQAQRTFEGRLPLSAFRRLAASLATVEGEVEYRLDFYRDELGTGTVRVRAKAELPLACQRTLEVFGHPVAVDARLGLLVDEKDEAALPAGYEPLLLSPDGLRPVEAIEDELILALPAIPVKPGTQEIRREWTSGPAGEAADRPHPFAVLKNVKSTR